MTKETTFPHPPGGHAAILAWDSVNERWQAVYVDASGNLQVDVVASGLPSGAATAAKQLPDGHNVTVDNASLAVTGTFYPETQAVSVASLPASGAQLYCYDNGSWIPVATSNDDAGNPIVAIGRGANVAQMGNIGGDGVATTIKVMFTGGVLYGFNGTTWDRLRCDDYNLNVNQHQYDGSTWRKSNLLWGYHDRLYEDLGGTKSGAGEYTAYSTAVPAGEVHIVQSISFRNMTGARGAAQLRLYSNSAFAVLEHDSAPAQYVPLLALGNFPLKEDDRVRVNQASCLDADVLQAAIWGYKMDIAM